MFQFTKFMAIFFNNIFYRTTYICNYIKLNEFRYLILIFYAEIPIPSLVFLILLLLNLILVFQECVYTSYHFCLF